MAGEGWAQQDLAGARKQGWTDSGPGGGVSDKTLQTTARAELGRCHRGPRPDAALQGRNSGPQGGCAFAGTDPGADQLGQACKMQRPPFKTGQRKASKPQWRCGTRHSPSTLDRGANSPGVVFSTESNLHVALLGRPGQRAAGPLPRVWGLSSSPGAIPNPSDGAAIQGPLGPLMSPPPGGRLTTRLPRRSLLLS